MPELLWREQGSPESGTLSVSLTLPDCFLQVQLDTLPGMSLVAGKALSSARMSDAVLSQSSLMGSQQFQDGEDEGKALSMDTPGQFPRGTAPDFCRNSSLCEVLHTVSLATHLPESVCVRGSGFCQHRVITVQAATGGTFSNSSFHISLEGLIP